MPKWQIYIPDHADQLIFSLEMNTAMSAGCPEWQFSTIQFKEKVFISLIMFKMYYN